MLLLQPVTFLGQTLPNNNFVYRNTGSAFGTGYGRRKRRRVRKRRKGRKRRKRVGNRFGAKSEKFGPVRRIFGPTSIASVLTRDRN